MPFAKSKCSVRAAVVTFDDTRTSVDALIKAAKGAGYPSTRKRER